MKNTQVYGQDHQLFQEAISKIEDPRQKGAFITSDADGKCYLVLSEPRSGRLSQLEIVSISATIQIKDGVQQQVWQDEIIAKHLCIFMFGANFGSKAESTGRLLPKEPGTFQVYTLQRGLSKPMLLSASVAPDCQLDLTAIAVGNDETKGLIGLRAVFPGCLTGFGVVAITASQEILSLWYREKLESASPCVSPTGEDKYSYALFSERYWGDDHEG